MGSEFSFPPSWLILHPMCTSRLQWSKLQFGGCLEVAPRSTTIHLNSRQYGQSLGTLIQGLIGQKILEHAWQMGFLVELLKLNKVNVQFTTVGSSRGVKHRSTQLLLPSKFF